jgi:cell shape-determining protein MreC
MVSSPETIPSCLLMTSSDATREEILTRLASLEEEVEQLREENQEFRSLLHVFEL